MPDFVIRVLEGMGVSGAIIFVLMSVILVLAGIIRVMYIQANKVYGYRLAERDTLQIALRDSAHVQSEMLKATEDRNTLQADMSDLIAKQSAAFELLKTIVIAQYDGIKEANHVITQAVSSQAASLRELTSIVTDHRNLGPTQITEVKQAIIASQQSITTFLNNALGAGTIIRRIVPRGPKAPQ